jgi:hypothetical protein
MPISQIPAPAAASAGQGAFAATIAATQTTYEQEATFEAGIYTITVAPATTNCEVVFVSETAVLFSAKTTSGTVSGQIGSAATRVFITTLAGGSANAIVTIEKSASILTADDIGNGTLDTVNTTGTYNQTGLLSVLAIGGGHAGTKGTTANNYGGGGTGGAAGGVALGMVWNNGATTVTIGAKGTAATSNNTNLVEPNASSFGNAVVSSTNSLFYVSGAGNGTGDEQGGNNVGTAGNTFVSFNGNSTNGGGGGGWGTRRGGSAGRVGGGSGIGTGGTSAPAGSGNGNNSNPTTAANAATGKGAGGGAGSAASTAAPNAVGAFGADGSDGVVYILRGF